MSEITVADMFYQSMHRFRATTLVFDVDPETGDVPVREIHVLREAEAKPG
jgi:hypothetical protein